MIHPSLAQIKRSSLASSHILFPQPKKIIQFNSSSSFINTKQLDFDPEFVVEFSGKLVLYSGTVQIETENGFELLSQINDQYLDNRVLSLTVQDDKLVITQETGIFRLDENLDVELYITTGMYNHKYVRTAGEITIIGYENSKYKIFNGEEEISVKFQKLGELFTHNGYIINVNRSMIEKIDLNGNTLRKLKFREAITKPNIYSNFLVFALDEDVMVFNVEQFKSHFVIKRQIKLFEAYNETEFEIHYIQAFKQQALIVQGSLLFILSYQSEPEITNHFMLAPSIYESFFVHSGFFFVNWSGKCYVFNKDLNTFNGKIINGAIKCKNGCLIQENRIIQINNLNVVQIKKIEREIVSAQKLKNGNYLVLTHKFIYELDNENNVVNSMQTESNDFLLFKDQIILVNQQSIVVLKKFQVVKQINFNDVQQVIAHPGGYLMVRQHRTLQLFTQADNIWYECGKKELETDNYIQIDNFGLFVVEQTKQSCKIRKINDFKVVVEVDPTIYCYENINQINNSGIQMLKIQEIIRVRDDARKQFIQDIQEFWDQVQPIKW
ncbi:Conserved_hypothetical protein [Hexamita inflata]|uniref:Uncharacterized protein n=1 Tax=Hexamita inflata TaxID=28002 RepID=A0AA86Q803_9EUKA|nr:Conserved hypothetical protein [Hexamita inflata]